MADPTVRRQTAEQQVAIARRRLTDTATELRRRLSPRTVVHEVADKARDEGTAAVKAGVGIVRRHPGATAGAGALIGLLAIGGPLARLLKRRWRNRP